jgi:threonine dehydrogenase-like Zn-dependent dehydrogenase
MNALQYRRSIPRYAALRFLGPRWPRLYTSGVSPVTLRDIPEPALPTPQWVRIAPRLAGICGSDIATVCAKGSPYLAPVTSMPFVLGHELVGVVSETGDDAAPVRVGDRVVLHPALGCSVRGIAPPCDACREGADALCRNVTRGDIAAGIQTGYCRDTGGAFGESLVAHRSQVYRVPDEIEDRAAVLIEPFACALHAALKVTTAASDTILVIGCGTIGLLTIAALRATGSQARIVAAAMFDHQKTWAKTLGADELIESHGAVATRFRGWASVVGADVLAAELGKPTVVGGADITFDCVAASSTIDDGLRFTRSGGTFVLVGMPGVPSGVDWTPLWYKELALQATYAYGPERSPDGVRDTFEVAIDLMRTWGPKLAPLTGTPFTLADYRAAFAAALYTERTGIVKTTFAVGAG